MLVILIYIVIIISLCCSMPHRLRPLVTNTVITPCDCSNHTNPNVDGEKKGNHANNGDVSIELKLIKKKGKLCIHKGCETQASYGIEGGKPEYCFNHKLKGMIDVKNLKCIHEGLSLIHI